MDILCEDENNSGRTFLRIQYSQTLLIRTPLVRKPCYPEAFLGDQKQFSTYNVIQYPGTLTIQTNLTRIKRIQI